jgi:oligoendopeptidase F
MSLHQLHQLYQQWQAQLKSLSQQIQANLEAVEPAEIVKSSSNQQVIQERLAQIQQFHQNLANLNLLDETIQAQLQPIQTEISKQLRLLETDAIFLKAARQPATAEQRQQQIQQRLELLLKYCDAVISKR